MESELVVNQAPPLEALSVQDWGLIDYPLALQRQMDLVDLVRYELARDTIVFCSHPAVVTKGRATQQGDVFGFEGPVIEVSRGGRATYHGPSQIVAYPILDLNQRNRDIHRHMRNLEQAIVETLGEFGIQAEGRSSQISETGEKQDATGVWIGSKKIASVGIGVRQWVSFHGLALNVDHDPKAFRGMNPCGFSPQIMTSVEEVLGVPVSRALVQDRLQSALLRILNPASVRANA